MFEVKNGNLCFISPTFPAPELREMSKLIFFPAAQEHLRFQNEGSLRRLAWKVRQDKDNGRDAKIRAIQKHDFSAISTFNKTYVSKSHKKQKYGYEVTKPQHKNCFKKLPLNRGYGIQFSVLPIPEAAE